MDTVVADVAGHNRFAAPVKHDARPVGGLPSGMRKVSESADVVHLHVALASADLAGIRQESRDEFLLRIVHPNRLSIGEFRRPLPLEGNPTEPGHQWCPVLPLDSGLETVFAISRGPPSTPSPTTEPGRWCPDMLLSPSPFGSR
jgi:hypothetical protein